MWKFKKLKLIDDMQNKSVVTREARACEVGTLSVGSQKIQTSSYKITKYKKKRQKNLKNHNFLKLKTNCFIVIYSYNAI